jgi:hypothetical protein
MGRTGSFVIVSAILFKSFHLLHSYILYFKNKLVNEICGLYLKFFAVTYIKY